MFEKNNLNTLYLAHITIEFGDIDFWRSDKNSKLAANLISYRNWTVLKYIGENKFIDLNCPKDVKTRIISTKDKRCEIQYIEPLSNYYTQDGKRKTKLSNRKVIKEASKHYNKAYEKSHEVELEKRLVHICVNK